MKQLLKKYPVEKLTYLLLLLAGVFGAFSALFHKFPIPGAPELLVISLAAAAVFACIGFLPSQIRRWVWLILLALWLVTAWQFREQLMWGIYRCFEYFLPVASQHFYVNYPSLPPLTAAGRQTVMLSSLFVLLPYLALLAWSVVRCKSFWLSLLFTAPLVAFSWGIQNAVPAPALGFSLLFWIAMGLQSGIPRAYRAKAPVPLLCILLPAGVLAVLISVVTPASYTPWAKAPALRTQISDAASAVGDWFSFLPVSFGEPFLGSNSGDVNLNTAWRFYESEQDVLRVYCEEPSTLYLRGYSASVYTGNRWLQPNRGSYPAEGFGFDPLAYLSGQELEEGSPSDIIVEPLMKNSRYLFTPYLITEVGAVPAPRWERDAYLSGGKQQSCRYQSLAPALGEYFISGDSGPVFYPAFTTPHVMPYTHSYNGQPYHFLSISGYGPWLDDNPEYETSQDAADLLRYFFNPPQDFDTFSTFYPPEELDFAYMRYILEEYTKLPDGLRDTMLSWWNTVYTPDNSSVYSALYSIQNAAEGNVPYWKWSIAAGEVAEIIRRAGTYTTTPNPHPHDRDFVEYFLTEGKEGDCVYFASAATVVLRALGVPARYVEGYVVEESRFGADGWATVPGKNAHAWAEIWIPGTGWIPVEATPGGMSAAPLTNAAEPAPEPEPSPEPTPEPTPEPSESPSPEPSETPALEPPAPSADNIDAEPPPAGEGSGIHPAIYLLLAAVLAALPFLLRFLSLRRRERLFFQDDPNQAALEIYQSIERLRRYGGPEESEEVTALALKARFSTHKISPDELKILMRQYHLSRATAHADMPNRLRPLFWMEGF